ncbi:MAG TPA: uroporphyrinogen-III synthase [Arsenophonus apicola]|uniref:uroporphyrinogen-III synthase n=1 Tax=Arsenophonus TaxID=637 RepID=UPI0015D8F5A3|nr:MULTISPECIES: uroporphyrinogen-III synthase [Arsenophonus]UBX29317.1 uroporphyrinogen-III synthase [Arsenophonus apicola]
MSILVTRPNPSGETLVRLIKSVGKMAFHAPLIEIMPGNELNLLPSKLASLTNGDRVFFLSPNAVWHANSALHLTGRKWPDTLSYYGIGDSTALAFHQLTNLPIHSSHKGETSETLLELPGLQSLLGKKSLLLRGNGGRELLAATLKSRGSHIDYCECYQRQPIKYDRQTFQLQWQQANISTIIVTSGEMLHLLFNLIMDDVKPWLLSRHLIVVSERLASTAYQFGWQSVKVAKSANNDALIQALM